MRAHWKKRLARLAEVLESVIRQGDFGQGQALMESVAENGDQTVSELQANYILKNKPNAKVGVLYQNDDYGKDYVKGLKDGLGAKAASMIVVESSYEVTSCKVKSPCNEMRIAYNLEQFFVPEGEGADEVRHHRPRDHGQRHPERDERLPRRVPADGEEGPERELDDAVAGDVEERSRLALLVPASRGPACPMPCWNEGAPLDPISEPWSTYGFLSLISVPTCLRWRPASQAICLIWVR